MSIDFEHSPEQRALAATARDLFAKEAPPSRLRAVWEGAPFDRDLWRTLCDVGLVGVAVPAEHGGMGGDEIDLALVLEEIGRACLSEPLAEAMIAARVLTDGDDLAALASGDLIAVATDEPAVPDADVADVVIAGGRLLRDTRTERIASVDHGRRLYRVVGDGPEVDVADRAAWARASVLNGVSARLLDDTVAYARERHQFGAPIGSFQAVKHPLATGHALLVSARAAAHGAAFALARGRGDAARAVSAALVAAIDAHAAINRSALQIHGGIGFTFEHDLHRWLKRGLALSFGGAEHRARLAAALFEENSHA